MKRHLLILPYRTICPCGVDDTIKAEMQEVAGNYSMGLRNLVESGRYDTREDFTVVYQSHLQNAKPPRKVANL